MYKNRKIVLASIAIIFSLIVCSIFVNYTLANSGTPIEESEIETLATSNTPKTNIDQAIYNSIKYKGEDKGIFHVVQIVPTGLASYAAADNALTDIVTEEDYKGDIKKETEYKNTTYLWKYVYDGEFFRYAVFNGYRSESYKKDMTKGAVQLKTVTVSELNSMGTDAQNILNSADLIYIAATSANDYGRGSVDLSEDLYSWLDTYTTVDNHPLIIDRYALCVEDPSSIVGNNDTYLMGSLAYKVMTSALVPRFSNVLVTESNFFEVLYKEAGENIDLPPVQTTTKTISDFILYAERPANQNGGDYINFNTYYKWYVDDSMDAFFNHNIPAGHEDSAYAKITAGDATGLTSAKKEWDFDNANVLIIADETNSDMFNQLSQKNDSPSHTADDYTYNKKTGVWESVTRAKNSELTGMAYNTGASGNYAYVPSGANIFVVQSEDILDGCDANTGTKYSNSDLAATYFKDVPTKKIEGTVKSKFDLTGTKLYLVVDNGDGVSKLGASDEEGTTLMTYELSDADLLAADEDSKVHTYSYSFPQLNGDFNYKVIIEPKAALVSHQHDMVYHEGKDASCDEDGNIEYFFCTECEKYFLDEAGENEISEEEVILPATGHEFATDWSYDEDYHWHQATCEKHNGRDDIEGNERAEHEWGDPATDEEGNTIVVCTVCGCRKTEEATSENTTSEEATSENTSSEDSTVTPSAGSEEATSEEATSEETEDSAPQGTPVSSYQVGSISTENGFDFDVSYPSDGQYTGYDYSDDDDTYAEYTLKAATDPSFSLDPYYDEYLVLKDAATVFKYVDNLYQEYKNDVLEKGITDETVIDFTNYDFVFIDSGMYQDEIGENAYNQLCAAVEAGVYFIVSSEAGDGVGSGDNLGGGDTPSLIITSPNAKLIADIINAGVYREGKDNKFRVLEIQPDYPIDMELAESNPTASMAWKKRSDGVTNVVGDYYTIPSDVVEGYAKEELPSAKKEYYDFDLTKAQIAYALSSITDSEIDLSYSNIELTQVSTEALIGMNQNLSSTYDLIYIGGDISAMDRCIDELYSSSNMGIPIYDNQGSMFPTFIQYYHTGVLKQLSARYHGQRDVDTSANTTMAFPVIGSTTYRDAFIAENGNDLTLDKYDQLMDYVNSNRPIMISKELSEVYDNMARPNAQSGEKLSMQQLLWGYWYNDNGTLERKNYYLDPSSRMYYLIGNIAKRYNETDDKGVKKYSNIVWGFDSSDSQTKKIANEDGTYGTTYYTAYKPNSTDEKIYTNDDAKKQSWYNSDDETIVARSYATVYNAKNSALISNLVKSADARVRLNVDGPTTYKEGIVETYLTTSQLQFTFSVSGSGTYNYKLYVDKNKDTTFDETNDYYYDGKIAAGEEKTINVLLDSDFFGSAYWYLEITDADGVVVATKNGISKIINTSDEKNEINVLQIQTMTKGQDATTWGTADTLYFDIQSQTAHKILKYNTWSNQEDFDNSSYQQYAVLGRHENRFGIIEYNNAISKDDYYSNLADAITDDYDVNLDMVVAQSKYAKFKTADNVSDSYDCLDTWVEEAETLKAGGKVDGHTQAEYKTMAADALVAYNNALQQSEASDGPVKKLQKYINGAIQVLRGTYTGTTNYDKFFATFKGSVTTEQKLEVLEFVNATGEYYMLYNHRYSANNGEPGTDLPKQWDGYEYGNEFGELYKAYIKCKNAEIEAKETYNKYLRRSYGENFLKKMYSILVLGPSEAFGGCATDLSETTCLYVLDYISKGGDLFLFHDSMTPFADGGSKNLTKSLIDAMGMNRFHVDLTQGTNLKNSMPELAGKYKLVDRVYDVKNSSGTWQNGQKYQDLVYATIDTDATKYPSPTTQRYYMTPYDANLNGLLNSMNYGYYLKAYAANPGWQAAVGPDHKVNISALSMTYLYYDNNSYGGNTNLLPYVYAQQAFQTAVQWASDETADQSGTSQTVSAKQLNEGLVTLYPYNIGQKLNISGTHQQAYALDLESGKVKVWYTLAGSNNVNNAKVRSSLYAADPYDAMENYFIYTTSYGGGAVTYCGAGHASVTGPTTKNNDERKLFINVIVNSAEAVPARPSIKLYEPDGEFKTEMEKDEEIAEEYGKTVYVTKTGSKTEAPEFDFKVTLPDTDTKLSMVNVYYDLDWNEDWAGSKPGFNDETDKKIATYTDTDGDFDDVTTSFAEKVRKDIRELTPDDSYFAPYGGNYTYIVVEAYYFGGKTPVYAILKIKASDPLFELTQANTAISFADAIIEKKSSLS